MGQGEATSGFNMNVCQGEAEALPWRAYCSLRRLLGRGSGGVTGALSPGEGGAREGGALGAELALGRSGGAATIGDVDEANITGGMPGAGGAIVSYCRTWRPCKKQGDGLRGAAQRGGVDMPPDIKRWRGHIPHLADAGVGPHQIKNDCTDGAAMLRSEAVRVAERRLSRDLVGRGPCRRRGRCCLLVCHGVAMRVQEC